MNYYIGVDPGITPAICVINNTGDIHKIKMFKDREGFPHDKFYLFCDLLANSINSQFENSNYAGLTTVCEKPHSVYGASAKSNFQFGLSVGCCIQQLVSSFADVYTVSPKIWQKEVIITEDRVNKPDGKKDTKATALKAAKRILGDKWKDEDFLPTERSKVVNHNMIDAFLISYYGYLQK